MVGQLHYEKRLENDLREIRDHVALMSDKAQENVANAIKALFTDNRSLAAAVILADKTIDQFALKTDRLCDRFIALHLPTAGHLRLLTSTIRIDIEIERIGDYAVNIARYSLQLKKLPQGNLAKEFVHLSDQAKVILHRALNSFNSLDREQAQATIAQRRQIESDWNALYNEIMRNKDRMKKEDLVKIFGVHTHIKRIFDQSINICEETVFATTGAMTKKPPNCILFVDENNTCASQMACAIGRKIYGQRAKFTSAGRNPGKRIDDNLVSFLEQLSIKPPRTRPRGLEKVRVPSVLVQQDIVISLQGTMDKYFPQLPFHTTPLEWQLSPSPSGKKIQKIENWLETIYREMSLHLNDLFQALHAEDTH